MFATAGQQRRHIATVSPSRPGGTLILRTDIPLPAAVVRFLRVYVDRALAPECEALTPDTPLFWSSWGKSTVGRTRAPMTQKNIWRLCKTYGKLVGYPELKPHDLRPGVAVEVLEQRLDLEEVRALLGHARIDATQIYTKIRPPQLKRAVAFYEDGAERPLGVEAVSTAPRVSRTVDPGSKKIRLFLTPGAKSPTKSLWWLQREAPVRL